MPDPRRSGARAPGRPPKSGSRALARHLASGTLDRRTWVAKELQAVMDALADDRGGISHCTAGERLLIERVAAETLFCRLIESWALRQPSIIATNGDGPRLLAPLAKGYTAHLAALTRALQALGLRPDKVERLPDLNEYLEGKQNGHGDEQPTPARAASDAMRPEAQPTAVDAAGAHARSDSVTEQGR